MKKYLELKIKFSQGFGTLFIAAAFSFSLSACFQMPSMDKELVPLPEHVDGQNDSGIVTPLPIQVTPTPTITPLSVPSAPTNLAKGNVTASSVVLSWSPSLESSGAPISYRLYRVLNGSNTLIKTDLTSLSFRADLPAGTVSYFVRGYNQLGGSPNSNTVTVAPASPNPSAPSDVVATLSGNQAQLSWSASSSPVGNAITYQVYEGTAQSNVLQMQGLVGLSFTSPALTPAGSTHSFFVKAVDNVGNSSSASSVASVTLPVAAPNAPTGLTTSNLTYSSVKLSWNAVSGATSYQVFKKISGVSTLVSSNQTALNYTVTGLVPGTLVSFYVRATNSSGDSANSAEVSVTPSLPLPSTPTGVTATLSGVNAAVIAWNASTSPIGSAVTYRVYQGNASMNALLAQNLTTRSYTAQSLSSGTQSFFIQAVDSTNANYVSASSASVSVPVPVPTSSPSPSPTVAAPAAPTGLAASSVSYTSLNLNWTASARATSYKIFRTQGASTTQIGSGITTTSYAVSGLNSATAYSFNVQAVNTTGSSANSNTASATTQTPLPTTPTGVTATLSGIDAAVMSWNASTSPVGHSITYQVYLVNGSSNTLLTQGLSARTYTASGLSPSGSTKSFFIKAVDSAGYSSSNSSSASVSLPAAALPNAPTNLAASGTSYTSTTLSWTAATGGAGGGAITYRVFKTIAGSTTQIADGLSTLTYQVTGLPTGTAVSFSVKAINSAGASGSSNTASVTTSVPTPTTVAGVAAALQAPNSAVITWNASTSPVGNPITYQVYSGNAGTNRLLSQNLTSRTFTATGLTQGATESFFIKAADNAGLVSAISNIASVAIPAPAPSPPVAPTGLTASNVTSNSAILSWNAVAVPSGGGSVTYGVSKVVNGTATVVSSNLTGTSYSISGLTSGSRTEFFVVAKNSVGTSPHSSSVFVSTTVAAGSSVGTARIANFKTAYYRILKMLGIYGNGNNNTSYFVWGNSGIQEMLPDVGNASAFTKAMMFPYTKLAIAACVDMNSVGQPGTAQAISGLNMEMAMSAGGNSESKWTTYMNELGKALWGRVPTAAEITILTTLRNNVNSATASAYTNNARAVASAICGTMALSPDALIE